MIPISEGGLIVRGLLFYEYHDIGFIAIGHMDISSASVLGRVALKNNLCQDVQLENCANMIN